MSYTLRRRVDRLLGDLGFDGPLVAASATPPRFVALCDDDDGSYRPSFRQKQSCCALPSGVPRLKRPRIATDASTAADSVVSFPQVTSQSTSCTQIAIIDLDASSMLTYAASPKSASSQKTVTFDDYVDDAELLKADTTEPNPGPPEEIIGFDDSLDDSVLLEAETCESTFDCYALDTSQKASRTGRVADKETLYRSIR